MATMAAQKRIVGKYAIAKRRNRQVFHSSAQPDYRVLTKQVQIAQQYSESLIVQQIVLNIEQSAFSKRLIA